MARPSLAAAAQALVMVSVEAGSSGTGQTSLQGHRDGVRAVLAAVKASGSGPASILTPSTSQELLGHLSQLCMLSASGPRAGTAAATLLSLHSAVAEFLAKLPAWHSPAGYGEAVAAALALLARLLQAHTPASGSQATANPSQARALARLLRAVQALLPEGKAGVVAGAAPALLPSLQQLFVYGRQDGGPLEAPASSRSMSGLPPPASPDRQLPGGGGGGRVGPRYRPPHARAGKSPSGCSRATALPAAPWRRGGEQLSSDSESSDSEGPARGGGGDAAAPVRLAALASLQLLAKADPKALHPFWAALLPSSDPAAAGGVRARAGAAPLAEPLLRDPQPRVRQAAAASLATLLEGPAQRAYLAVAEARGPSGRQQPMRGFTTLSASLGRGVVCTHAALLCALGSEGDDLALAAALRALGTLLVGAPYPRLPPQLLWDCVQAVQACLARLDPGELGPEQASVASACLSCLAAAFAARPPCALLAERLLESETRQLPALLLAFAASGGSRPLQLEAALALRGLAQQYHGALLGCWKAVLLLARSAASGGRAPTGAASPRQSPRAQTESTVEEKAAHQRICLAGDFLSALDSSSSSSSSSSGGEAAAANKLLGVGLADLWQQAADAVLGAAAGHASASVRSAAQAVIGSISPARFGALAPSLQQRLLAWACAGASGDVASPVRAAAAKALGSLVASNALLALPQGPQQVLLAVQATCSDGVVAVRTQAAGALASWAGMLSTALAAGASCQGQTAQVASMLPALLQLATLAASDHEKVRPGGALAIGLLSRTAAAAGVEVQRQDAAAAVEALAACLRSGSAKVQWSACSGAAAALEGSSAGGGHSGVLLAALLELVDGSPNLRTRASTAEALCHVGSVGGFGGTYLPAVQAIADALFEGSGDGLGSKPPASLAAAAHLRAQLAATLLRLLALAAGERSDGMGHGADLAAVQCQLGQHAEGMQRLVDQAREATLGPGAAAGPWLGGAFDVSLVAPIDAQRALSGLHRLLPPQDV